MYVKGDWFVYCDICGQRSYASKSTKLSMYTGRGGLVVCKHDVDRVDPGLEPFNPRKENSLPRSRPGHINTSNSSPLVDLETMTYSFYLVASQDNAKLLASQDDARLVVNEAF